MVRALSHQPSMQKSRSFQFKRMFENPGRQVQSLILESGHDSHGMSRAVGDNLSEPQQIGWALSGHDKGPVSCLSRAGVRTSSNLQCKPPSDVELMKERFAKLLLGEDMSGGGKGVSSALALSNAITNLAASVFGDHKLEPMSPSKKARWRKEIEWLLSVTDHIVEFVPSKQQSQDGTYMEIMVTRQRIDLLMNIPALRKLDIMLIDCLDHFGENQTEFWYASGDDESDKDSTTKRDDNKWWLPTAKVPPNGLSEVARKWMLFQKDSINQILKAAMAINAQVLSEMQIPDSYIESLPKNGRASLGDSIYKSITDEYFDPQQFLSTMDLTTDHKVVDLKNRIEASIVIWKRKMNHKDGKSSWGSSVSLEKRELFEERAETILRIIKLQFPGIPQSSLDISKIQYNKDIGQSILESYSRVIESLAFNIMSRIEDVLHADSLTQDSPTSKSMMHCSSPKINQKEDIDIHLSPTSTMAAKTLSDFMGWNLDKGITSDMKKNSTLCNMADKCYKEEHDKLMSKPATILTTKKFSYLEKLESLSGLRSPTARH